MFLKLLILPLETTHLYEYTKLIKGLLPNIDADIALFEAFFVLLEGPMKTVGIIALFAVLLSTADTWLFNCTSIFLQDMIKTKKKRYFQIIFIAFSLIALLIAFFFRSIVDIVLIYASIYMLIGSYVLYDLLFKLNTKYSSYVYIISTIILITFLIVIKLNPILLVLTILIIPLSYGIAKLTSQFLFINKKG